MKKQFSLKPDKEFITLSQLLKMEAFVQSGGEVRFFLGENPVYLNGEIEVRRGKKLYVGDVINIQDVEIEIVGA